MKFNKTIDISEFDIVYEINENYSNEKLLNFIMKILPEESYPNRDIEFLFLLLKKLSNKLVEFTKDCELEDDAKKLRKEIKELYDKANNFLQYNYWN